MHVTAPGYYHQRDSNDYHAAALTGDGLLYTWGANHYGQLLALGTAADGSDVPDVYPRPRLVPQLSTLNFAAGADCSPREVIVKVGVGLFWSVVQTEERSDDGATISRVRHWRTPFTQW